MSINRKKFFMIGIMLGITALLVTAKADESQIRIFELRWKSLDEVMPHINSMLSRSGNAVGEPRSHRLIVRDTVDRLWEIERYLSRVDKNDLEYGTGTVTNDLMLEGIIRDGDGVRLTAFSLLTPPGFEARHEEVEKYPVLTDMDSDKWDYMDSGVRIWLKAAVLANGSFALRSRLWVGQKAGIREGGQPIIKEFTGDTQAVLNSGEPGIIEFRQGDRVLFTCEIICQSFQAGPVTLESLLQTAYNG